MKNSLIKRDDKGQRSPATQADKDTDFEKKLATFRKKTFRPELVEVPFRCSKTGDRAVYIYEKGKPDEKYRLIETRKIEIVESSPIGRFFSNPKSTRTVKSYNSDDFNDIGRACPWCGSDRFVVDCPNCHEATCGGTTRRLESGSEQHTCHPGCKANFSLGPATRFSGGKPESRGVLDGPGKKSKRTREKAHKALPNSASREIEIPKPRKS